MLSLLCAGFSASVPALCTKPALTPTCTYVSSIFTSADLDPINRKLLTHTFRKTGPMQAKKPPAVWCMGGTSNAELWASHMAAMQETLTGW
jgi:hypothetical protein